MEELKHYLKTHPRILGAFTMMVGLWLSELVYRRPLEIILSGKGELSLHEKTCVFSVALIFLGVFMIVAPKKIMEWAGEAQARKETGQKYRMKDIAVGFVFIIPGLIAYHSLKWFAESKGFVFR